MNKLLIFGFVLTNVSAFMIGAGCGSLIGSAVEKSKHKDWNITTNGYMNFDDAVVGAWLKTNGTVVIFKQSSLGITNMCTLDNGSIELSNGNGASIVVNKIDK